MSNYTKYSKYNKSYSDVLQDPRWQRKRLEIMNRDNFTCQACNDTTEILNVHHLRYFGKPWEVDDKYLITLCKKCHDLESNTDLSGLFDEIAKEHDVLKIDLAYILVATKDRFDRSDKPGRDVIEDIINLIKNG